MNLTFGSVCSGIEAASVAWHPLGWRAVWLAEIEPFPSMVLHHHYDSGRPLNMPSPDDDDLDEEDRDARRAAIRAVAWLPETTSGPRNLGDFTKIANLVRNSLVSAPDVLVGGTPCQAFSIAGLRNSMADARGQLTLSFVDLANAIDAARSVLGKPPAIITWENVPGVLNTDDNAFGCFLGALAGEDDPIIPPGKKWANAGCVFGPQRTIAWRVTDAQYFGVPQRRRRVFVIASAREGFDPTAVLFEFDGVRRDSAPSREAREGVADGFEIGPSSGRLTDVAPTLDCRAKNGPIQNQLGAGVIWPAEVAPTLNAAFGSKLGLENQHIRGGQGYLSQAELIAGGQLARCLTTKTRIDAETETLIPTIGGVFVDAPVLSFKPGQSEKAGGIFITEDYAPTLQAANNGSTAVPAICVARTVALRGREGGATAELGDEIAGCLRASSGGGDKPHVLAPIAFDSRQDCVSSTAVFGSLGSSSPQAQAICITGDITHTLKAEGFDASEDGTGRGQPIVAAYGISNQPTPKFAYELSPPLDAKASGGGRMEAIAQGMAVRRLTPVECERLQDFPDNHTLVPTKRITQARAESILAKGDPAVLIGDQWWQQSCDGPRYKALGNSMCTSNMAWLGRRIEFGLSK